MWDITKSLAVILLVVILWVKIIPIFENKSSVNYETPPEVLVQLTDNQWQIRNLQANNAEAKALIARLEAERGQQAQLIEFVKAQNAEKDARLEEIGVVVAELQRTVEKLRTASTVAKTPEKTGDPEEDKRRELLAYEMKKIYAKDALDQEFPVAWAMNFPNQTPDKRWKSGTYPQEYHVTVIETENEDGTFDRAAEFHIENNTNKETKGKEFPIALKSFEWEKFEIKEKKFSWWNPRLGFGGTFTGEDMAPKIDFSFSSYGRTKRDMDWRFFTFGIGAAKAEEGDEWKAIGSFAPFSWNIGTELPLIENLFIEPIVTYDSDNKTSFGVGVSIPF